MVAWTQEFRYEIGRKSQISHVPTLIPEGSLPKIGNRREIICMQNQDVYYYIHAMFRSNHLGMLH